MGLCRDQFEDGKVVREQRLFHELDKRIRHIMIGPDGELYLLTDHNPGQVLRVDAAQAADDSD